MPYTLEIERGYVGPVEVDFGEDVTGASGTFAAYASPTSPLGTPLWTKTLGPGSTANRLRFSVTADDTAAHPAALYMRGERILAGVTFPFHGSLTIAGK